MTSNRNFKIENLYNVKGWVVVVTGSGTGALARSGIGLMIAQTFANNGAKVYIVGRRKDVLDNAVEKHGKNLADPSGQMIPLQADITSKESIGQLADEVGRREKYVNVLVNNAGIQMGTSEAEKGNMSAEVLAIELFEESWEEWLEVYQTNVVGWVRPFGYFFTSAAFLPLLNAATQCVSGFSGSIINISSISGIVRSIQHRAKYNISKAAAIHLTTLLAQEFSRCATKVRVNSIAPSVFPSELTAGPSDEANKNALSAEGWRENKQVPAGRPGREEDMAQAVLHFALNQYANGQTMAIDGGYLLGHP
ncbi:hypothetical protein K488DRAFT_71713 [Vararia minispora EC-137]|uniref:Uncharacterized protein n=1 Tax=Vararia minispora EC-137 TaxID=1314806 RepID=A0ACB8QGS0_9AGAM|nr:hypothetical protein K488DRAFT_71713 [Vararia minispora EC-137]